MQNTLFPGSIAFKLKDTHGVPLDFIVETIQDRGLIVEWPSFIEAARIAKWWDFQIFEQVEHALIDSGTAENYRKEILIRIKKYILEFPHPAMNCK